MGSDFSS